jgi:hypothetical protein
VDDVAGERGEGGVDCPRGLGLGIDTEGATLAMAHIQGFPVEELIVALAPGFTIICGAVGLSVRQRLRDSRISGPR